MRNTKTRQFEAENDALVLLLKKAKNEERKASAFVFSIHLEALADHIIKMGMSGKEAAELLRREAARFENESQELH